MPASADVRDQPAVEAGLGDVAGPARAAPGGVALAGGDADGRDRVSAAGVEDGRPVARDGVEALRPPPEEPPPSVDAARCALVLHDRSDEQRIRIAGRDVAPRASAVVRDRRAEA